MNVQALISLSSGQNLAIGHWFGQVSFAGDFFEHDFADKQLRRLHRGNKHLHDAVRFLLQHAAQHLAGEHDDDEVDEYKIVGSQEADPFMSKISNESPIAKAIMNEETTTSSKWRISKLIDKIMGLTILV